MLQDRAYFQLKQVNKTDGGKEGDHKHPGDLICLQYLLINWVDLTDSLSVLAGNDRLWISAMKTWRNRAGKENEKSGAAVFCCAEMKGPRLKDSLPNIATAEAQDHRCYKHVCFLLCALCCDTVILDVNEGEEIQVCTSLVSSDAKHPTCWGDGSESYVFMYPHCSCLDLRGHLLSFAPHRSPSGERELQLPPAATLSGIAWYGSPWIWFPVHNQQIGGQNLILIDLARTLAFPMIKPCL